MDMRNIGPLVLVSAIILFFLWIFLEYLRNKRAYVIAKKNGPVWAYNQANGITAVCLYSDLERAKRSQESELRHSPSRDLELLTSRMWTKVEPTFTFSCGEEYHMAVLTGTKEDYKRLLERLVHQVTGYRMDQLSDGDPGEGDTNWRVMVREELAMHRPSLFVPFASRGKAELAEQVQKFSHTLDSATITLLGTK